MYIQLERARLVNLSQVSKIFFEGNSLVLTHPNGATDAVDGIPNDVGGQIMQDIADLFERGDRLIELHRLLSDRMHQDIEIRNGSVVCVARTPPKLFVRGAPTP